MVKTDDDIIRDNNRNLQRNRTIRGNNKSYLQIGQDIIGFFKKGGIPILDRMPPNEGTSIREKYDSMINEKSTSAITITFNQTLRDNYEELELKSYLEKVLRIIHHNKELEIELLVIPDCDENGNFHYHGLIKMPLKYRAFFKRNITKYVGFMKMQYIDNIEGWTKYCFKDIYNEEEINKYSLTFKRTL